MAKMPLKPGVLVHPDPYHGHTGPNGPSLVPWGGVLGARVRSSGRSSGRSRGQSGPERPVGPVESGDAFTRLLLNTAADPKYQLCQNHHFLEVKNDLLKTDISVKKAYLILIVKCKMSIFDVFWRFWRFLVISGHLWFFGVFYCSGCVRFSHGFWQISVILENFLEIPLFSQFLQNVTDRSDTSKCDF